MGQGGNGLVGLIDQPDLRQHVVCPLQKFHMAFCNGEEIEPLACLRLRYKPHVFAHAQGRKEIGQLERSADPLSVRFRHDSRVMVSPLSSTAPEVAAS